MIKSNRYDAAFSFKVSDGPTNSAPVTLDGPQVFTGGSVALFGRAPRQLKFSVNASSNQTAIVEIFVARDATPEAQLTREPGEGRSDGQSEEGESDKPRRSFPGESTGSN